MRNYIIINGINSLTIPGLAINILPPISKPMMRYMREEIDGRDGDINTELGYQAYDRPLEVGLFGDYDVNQVIAFFNSQGKITFSDEPDKFYNFQILEKIDFTKLVKFRTATVNIHCQPFKYPLNETPLEEEYEYVEGEGTELTLNDTANAIFNKFDLKGNTSQVQYTGTNLFSADAPTKTQAGLTITNNGDGTYSISGTTTANVSIPLTIASVGQALTGGQAYTMGVEIISNGGSGGTLTTAILKNGTTQYNFFAISPQSATGMKVQTSTPSENATIREITYYAGNGAIINNLKIRPYLVKGSYSASTIPPYEPYVGGIPAPNPDYPEPIHVVSGDNEINICGKNLFDKDNVRDGYRLGSDGTYYRENNYSASEKIPVSPNTTYYRNVTIQQMKPVCTYDKDDNFIARLTSGNSFTTPSNCYYIRTAVSNTELDTCQLEKGNQATTYEPYIGNTYPVYLGVKNLWSNQTTGWIPTSGAYPTTNASYPNARYVLIKLNAGDSITLSNSTSENGRTRYIDTTTNQVVGAVSFLENDYYTTTTAGVTQFSPGTITAKKEVIIAILDIQGNVSDLIVNYGKNAQYISDTPIELCKIGTYQDYIYKDNDSWYLHKEVRHLSLVISDMDNNDNYPGWNNQTQLKQDYPSANNSFGTYTQYVCNIGVASGSSYATNPCLINTNTSGLLMLGTGYFHLTQTQWKEQYPNLIFDLYYGLATPTNTLIEDTTLIKQLEEIKNAISYNGQTNISQTNNDLPFILDLSALELGSDHLVINNQGNIYSKPTLDLEGSGIVEIYLNDSQILEADLTEAGEIVIDTEAMEATNPSTGLLANRQVTGDYSRIKLDPGENDLRFSGDLTKATITNYERWL